MVELETEGNETLAVRDNGRGMDGPGVQDLATYFRMQVSVARRFFFFRFSDASMISPLN